MTMKDPGLVTFDWIERRKDYGEPLSECEKRRIRQYYGIKKEMFEKSKASEEDFREVVKLVKSMVDDLHP